MKVVPEDEGLQVSAAGRLARRRAGLALLVICAAGVLVWPPGCRDDEETGCRDEDDDGHEGYDPDTCMFGTDFCDDDGDNWDSRGCIRCLDADGDGYGYNCDRGYDCDDGDRSRFESCPSPGWVAVTAPPVTGGAHTCAARDDGIAFCWGWNESAQLGDGTIENRETPTPVADLEGVVSLAAGGNHTCATLEDGTAWCWGSAMAPLGTGTFGRSATPAQVVDLEGVVEVAAGYAHSCAFCDDGSVWCWGSNDSGQLGTGGDPSMSTPAPVQVESLDDVRGLAAGEAHACALKGDGTVWCWGQNDTGQLGDGTIEGRSTPVQVEGLSNAVAIDAGQIWSCAINAEGDLWCWGSVWCTEGAGDPSCRATPTRVEGLPEVVDVAVGSWHACAVGSDGSVWCWGAGSDGILGSGMTAESEEPIQVIRISEASAVVAGLAHTCALLVDGSIWCWGSDERGQLGDGIPHEECGCAPPFTDCTPFPVRVADPE